MYIHHIFGIYSERKCWSSQKICIKTCFDCLRIISSRENYVNVGKIFRLTLCCFIGAMISSNGSEGCNVLCNIEFG